MLIIAGLNIAMAADWRPLLAGGFLVGNGGVALYFLHRRLPGHIVAQAVFAGALQPLVVADTGSRLPLLTDNILIFVALGCSLLVRRRVPRAASAMLGLLFLSSVLGLRHYADFTTATLEFRQVVLPVSLIWLGMRIRGADWLGLRRTYVRVAVCAAILTLLEAITGFRIADPLRYAHLNIGSVFEFHHLPGYFYYYYGGNAAPIIRAGGPLLNPTTSGLLIAGGALFLGNPTSRNLLPRLILLGGAAVTLSRGALLVVLLPLVVTSISRHTRRRLALAVAAGTAAVAGLIVSRHGGSGAHATGLLVALRSCLRFPIGRGYGFFGDIAAQRGFGNGTGESLFGVLLVAGGLASLAGLAFFFWLLLKSCLQCPREALYGTAGVLGLFFAASFSETAGALNATIALWVLAGRAIAFPDGETVTFHDISYRPDVVRDHA